MMVFDTSFIKFTAIVHSVLKGTNLLWNIYDVTRWYILD